MNRCLGCMSHIEEHERKCSICGYEKGTDVKEAYYLLPGKILQEKYLVGKVLGYGGFGVTYIGWDLKLERKIAIKEYLPSDFATRSYGTELLTVYSGEATIQFESGLQSFISEARRLAKFNNIPEIVDIYDCFMDNGTGYIIMEFLEGKDVKTILKEEGSIPVERATDITMHVLHGLSLIHKEGIIHRDIAPDNIFITNNNEVKILDFGASRYATAVQSRSLSVILKPGYAPEEQYRSRGNQGPWTDVYAMGATFYRMITGRRPKEAIERLANDDLETPSQLGIEIAPNVEIALMNSLNVKQEFRTRDAQAFYDELKSEEVSRVEEIKVEPPKAKMPLWGKCLIGVAGVVVIVGIGLSVGFGLGIFDKKIKNDELAQRAEDTEYVLDVSGMSYNNAAQILNKKNLKVKINGINYSDSIEKDTILSQIPNSGELARVGDTVYVTMSGGNQEVTVPDLIGLTEDEAKEEIFNQFLSWDKKNIKEEFSDVVAKGKVINQSIDAGSIVAVDTSISVTVSAGSKALVYGDIEVPKLVGVSYDEAIEILKQVKEDTGYTFTIGEITKEYNDTVEKNEIITQSLKEGEIHNTEEVINIVVSLGMENVNVKNVVYKDKESAKRILENAGLVVKFEEEYSSIVNKGLVISQSIPEKSEVKKGTTIIIKISLGEEKNVDEDTQIIHTLPPTIAPTVAPTVTPTVVPTVSPTKIPEENVDIIIDDVDDGEIIFDDDTDSGEVIFDD